MATYYKTKMVFVLFLGCKRTIKLDKLAIIYSYTHAHTSLTFNTFQL